MDSRSRGVSPKPLRLARRENVEYFQEYDRWAMEQADERCFRNPCVQIIGRMLSGFNVCLHAACNKYFQSHSSFCHMIVFFCVLNAIVAMLIGYAIRCRIAAFTVPAVHHKWDLNEKAAGCTRAAVYYAVVAFLSLAVSWFRSGSISLKFRGMLCRLKSQPLKKERRRNLLQRNVGRRVPEDSDDYDTNELHSVDETGTLHNRSRSGYASSGYTSSTANEDAQFRKSKTAFEVGVSGLVPKSKLALLGIGSSSGGDE